MNSIMSTNFPISMDSTGLGNANIKVIGIGGGGGNAINSMIQSGMRNVGFIVANTDTQALDNNQADVKITLGSKKTQGLGAGANPNLGLKAAQESHDSIKEALNGTDMLFITAGMGGGTGTGASPVIAKIAKELNILVVGIVTTPFHWEGIKRNKVASMGIAALSKFVDSIIVIPNDKLLSKDAEGNDFITTFKKIDNILVNAARGIVDIIDNHSFINVDFADVCTIMENSGRALMGIGTASGDNRATEAANAALNSPFLDNVTVEGAKGVLVKISAGELKMDEIDTVMEVIRKAANYENGSINEDDEFDNFGFDDDIKFEMKNLDDNVIFGCDLNPALGDKLQVTLIATDLNKKVTPQTNILNSQNVNFNNQINTNTNEKAQEIDTKVLVEENNQQKVANDEYVSTYKPPVNFPGLNFTSNKDNGNGRHLAKVPRGNDLSSFDSPAVDRRGDSSYQRNMLRNN